MLEVVCGRSVGGGGGKRFQTALRVAASATTTAVLTAFVLPAVRQEDELLTLRAAYFDSGLTEAYLLMLVSCALWFSPLCIMVVLFRG
jgi:hypothetical protein